MPRNVREGRPPDRTGPNQAQATATKPDPYRVPIVAGTARHRTPCPTGCPCGCTSRWMTPPLGYYLDPDCVLARPHDRTGAAA